MHLDSASLRLARVAGLIAATAVLLSASRTAAGPSLGFVEDWPGTSLATWAGGATLSNPGTGGAGGAGDGFLMISTAGPGNLGANSSGAQYAGDWTAAGIGRVDLSLRDIGAPQALEIHFAIGSATNFWQYNPGFVPTSQWTQFTVDLTSPGNFTRIIGSGTFAAALGSVDHILIRHDRAPFVQAPDMIQGDFGLDRVTLGSAGDAAAATTWGRIKRLYR